MKMLLLKVAVALPVFVTLRTLADSPPPFLVSWCFGFTAFLLADRVVQGWLSERASLGRRP